MDNFIPKMVTIKEAAKATGLAEYHVRQLCINSEITAVKTGKKYLINLDRFVDYLNTPPASVPVQNQAIMKIAE